MFNYSLFKTETDPGHFTDSVAVSSTNVYRSDPVSSVRGAGFGLTITWTGTPTGSFIVQKTDKKFPDFTTDTDWSTDSDFNGGTGTLATGGAAGQLVTSADNAKNHWWRVKYTNASSTGTIAVFVTKSPTV